MTLVFSLSIECGGDIGTEGVINYFKGKGGRYKVEELDELVDLDGNPWVRIMDRAEYANYYREFKQGFFEELTFKYYQELREISFFRYAMAGLEVDEFLTYNELIENLPGWDIPGLVISNEIAKEVGVESKFERFNSSHRWLPGWKLD